MNEEKIRNDSVSKKNCQWCGTLFNLKHPRTRFCCNSCKSKYSTKKRLDYINAKSPDQFIKSNLEQARIRQENILVTSKEIKKGGLCLLKRSIKGGNKNGILALGVIKFEEVKKGDIYEIYGRVIQL